MCLKSTPNASSISAPAPGFTLADFCAASGVQRLREDQVIPVDLFVSYGQWFQRNLVPDVEATHVRDLSASGRDSGFHLTLADGAEFDVPAVVVSSGLTGCAYLPPELAAAAPDGPSPAGSISHSSQHHDLSAFAGQEVVVIGAGQSALETAALLHEAGANVQLIARGQVRFGDAPPQWQRQAPGGRARLLRPASPLGPTWRLYPFSHAPGMFRYLPERTRLALVKRVLGPLGAWWLRDRVDGQFPIQEGQHVQAARRVGDKVMLTLAGADGRESEVKTDHVLAATGYRVNLDGPGFISADVRARLRCTSGSPRLSPAFESSVPGLYFTGMAGAATFGPLMRFVCGTGFASRQVSAAVARGVRGRSR
jgi:cation diffusion facilitator CzcD-associated flavoprotein CzcO